MPPIPSDQPPLSSTDRAIYEWQLDVPGFGEAGQARLRGATALVSRIGGLGGPIALELAAAGIGKLILVHGGNLELADLNRQILMRHDDLGKPRVDSARATLHAFNPNVRVETIDSHMDDALADRLVPQCDIVFDAAPRFPERFAMNRACVENRIPLVDAAMFNMEGQVLTVVPGETPCLACLYPGDPPHWKRRFPVIGAVSALIANIAVIEGLKLLCGFGPQQLNRLIHIDTATMEVKKIVLARNPDCAVCGAMAQGSRVNRP